MIVVDGRCWWGLTAWDQRPWWALLAAKYSGEQEIREGKARRGLISLADLPFNNRRTRGYVWQGGGGGGGLGALVVVAGALLRVCLMIFYVS